MNSGTTLTIADGGVSGKLWPGCTMTTKVHGLTIPLGVLAIADEAVE
jgi:hypothetical protein